MLKFKITLATWMIAALARLRCRGAKAFSLGAVEIDPGHLAIWVTVPSDAERDRLKTDAALVARFRRALGLVGYPAAAIPKVGFAFESEETVNRDHGGNWWYAVR